MEGPRFLSRRLISGHTVAANETGKSQ